MLVTLFCLIWYGKWPIDALGSERAIGLMALETLIAYIISRIF